MQCSAVLCCTCRLRCWDCIAWDCVAWDSRLAAYCVELLLTCTWMGSKGKPGNHARCSTMRSSECGSGAIRMNALDPPYVGCRCLMFGSSRHDGHSCSIGKPAHPSLATFSRPGLACMCRPVPLGGWMCCIKKHIHRIPSLSLQYPFLRHAHYIWRRRVSPVGCVGCNPLLLATMPCLLSVTGSR
jgi:hypothetical protein